MGKRLDWYGNIDKSYFIHAEIGFSQEEYNEREQWCIDNLVGDFHHNVAGIHCYDVNDAVLCKLRWRNG